MAGKAEHRGFGHIRKLPSGRYQASYIGPDLARHNAPTTFEGKDAATVWLRDERRAAESEDWRPPKDRRAAINRDSFESYATAWLAHRPLKPRTVAHYRRLVDRFLMPTFGEVAVRHITPESVRVWHASLDPATPTQNAHAYALLKAVLATAVHDDLLPANPCRIRGAGQARRASRTEPASVTELAALIEAMPERYRAMTALAGWCGLRFGELIELRRKDVDLRRAVVHVHRAASLVEGTFVIGTPKSAAGVRDVDVPPHVIPLLRAHVEGMGVRGRDALLFPSAGDPTKHLRTASLAKVFYRARAKIGRDDLRWHDLRHTAGSHATLVGATLADVMAMLGHSTSTAALRYQHQTKGRGSQVAELLSRLATGESS